ncbi:hypothetical protein M413DRAFT_59344 [Hebeloma cylindrosporum]|uniref:Prokaryotic-type class I peptide chain release factors domain-containing protein n=1 Tax=Hebeloma cylindrosporum TaxID=76867 RepID=A0A0C2Z8J2_HEBCY|nr:hypothetical protein M413DRAFT_59344 [Hebeloma cylindrosporum h7]
MSISPALKAATRSAYRDVLRAASKTFSGDPPVLQAFRSKMRSDISQSPTTDPETYQKQAQFIREVADVLRKNIVQGTRIPSENNAGDEVYRIRMTKDTELGDNETIKSPPPIESSRSNHAVPVDETCTTPSVGTPPRYFTALKKAHKERIVPELREEDLEESFVRGVGPGGQSINKTENNVQLLHKPTGLRVACQDTRSLTQNRKLARRWLLEKACFLDKLVNPGLSKEEMKAAKQRERERQRRKKAKKKAKKKDLEEDSDSNGP